ncbi:MAG: type II/IV secretion system protein [Candidatus Scalindua sp. AMX11]|nr:MAG: type II/IV secretion system protein [Candidatus Scalindua sp.]NOG83834.1 type II/IV secretion system protein [Planctomycetota bacterium]RZV82986.1 MAG: type II/IV secretion system protein [Candidatus Scalindua sp. SCAELEC01]TDE64488.1 MAG: type II/IV secretion system protein [Candidatus Scalindua sp. AMX11]GJQ58770.1 MAG: type IV-A pilus assembly ATPase PilB [Candidatus Scalindua sp.]
MENVECKLIDGDSVSGQLERAFRPIEGEIAIRSQDRIQVLTFDQISCVLFTTTPNERDQFKVRGLKAEEIKTITHEVYQVRIIHEDITENLNQGFYGVPINQENGPSYIFFPKTGIEYRGRERFDKNQINASEEKDHTPSGEQQLQKIGEILIDYNLATQEQINTALKAQRLGSTKYLGEILIANKIITEKELLMALALKFHLRSVDLRDIYPNPETLDLVPLETARKFHIFPIVSDKKKITIATSQPTDISVIDTLRFSTNRWVEMVLATHKQIETYIIKYYENESDRDEINIEEVLSDIEHEDLSQEISIKDEAEAAPVIRLANKILQNAVKEGSSDIHLLPQEKGLKVSYRVNGLLQQYLKLDRRVSKSLVARFKIVSLMDITERRLPQDGRFKVIFNNRPVEFRVSCMPGQHGENIVMRILNKSNDTTGLYDLGLDTKDVETIRHIVRSTHGMMLVTGPTGSGKSSTLAAVLRDLTDEPKHMLSLEDPIEIEVPGINQIQIHEKIGFTFASALRNVLRHDPDIIMLGEIRDSETAKISVQAALTGHVLISTLHTNSAAAAFSRLSDMGVEPYLVSATVKGIMAQQLLPRLCLECKVTQKPDDKILDFLSKQGIDTKDLIDHVSPGCENCRDSGISGRVLVYEFLAINRDLQALVSQEATLETIQKTACKSGMRTLVQMALEASQKGLISLDRILPLFIE